MSNRRLIDFLTASVDGFIARTDGGVDWLIEPSEGEDFDLGEFSQTIDTVIFGRKTYEKSLSFGGEFPFAVYDNYVFSNTLTSAEHAKIVSGDVTEFLTRLRQQPGKNIWLIGGGELAARCFAAGQIDELVVHVQPILLGEGLPLVARIGKDVKLQLRRTKSYAEGLVMLVYDVLK